MTRRSFATTALLTLLVLEAAAATAFGVVVVSLVTAGDDAVIGPLDPTALGILTVGLSMLLALVVLVSVSAVGLWQRRPWAATTAGLVHALLLVGAAVGLFSLGWQPVLGLLAALGVLGLLLVTGRAREVPR
ncbi:hypothetical protein [Egicoccus sp. AB-alg6-2]|uniref:hypothetical protein n=1 Tax=Egicoccus sp. AB-alg6-2 TaxID=3242692 RepID=UPI00359D97A6